MNRQSLLTSLCSYRTQIQFILLIAFIAILLWAGGAPGGSPPPSSGIIPGGFPF